MEGRTPTPKREHVITEESMKLYDSSKIWDVMRVAATPPGLASSVQLLRSSPPSHKKP